MAITLLFKKINGIVKWGQSVILLNKIAKISTY